MQPMELNTNYHKFSLVTHAAHTPHAGCVGHAAPCSPMQLGLCLPRRSYCCPMTEWWRLAVQLAAPLCGPPACMHHHNSSCVSAWCVLRDLIHNALEMLETIPVFLLKTLLPINTYVLLYLFAEVWKTIGVCVWEMVLAEILPGMPIVTVHQRFYALVMYDVC